MCTHIKTFKRDSIEASLKLPFLSTITPRYTESIEVSQQLPVILKRKGQLGIYLSNWGFAMKDNWIANARMETIDEKLMFKNAQPLIIPITQFKETIWFESNKPLYAAGLWRVVNKRTETVLLTKPSENPIKSYKDRMPVLIKNVNAWLDSRTLVLDKPMFTAHDNGRNIDLSMSSHVQGELPF